MVKNRKDLKGLGGSIDRVGGAANRRKKWGYQKQIIQRKKVKALRLNDSQIQDSLWGCHIRDNYNGGRQEIRGGVEK